MYTSICYIYILNITTNTHALLRNMHHMHYEKPIKQSIKWKLYTLSTKLLIQNTTTQSL